MLRMLNQTTAELHPFFKTSPATPWEAPDPLPVMRREMKLLLIELNRLRVEVEQLRAASQEAHNMREALTASVARITESRDHWQREAERLSGLMARVPPWSIFWWRCG
jgi:FtsZ-binding cell division protein ZapB